MMRSASLILGIACLLPQLCFAETIVAARTIRAQSILSATDLAFKDIEVAGGVKDASELIGMESRVAFVCRSSDQTGGCRAASIGIAQSACPNCVSVQRLEHNGRRAFARQSRIRRARSRYECVVSHHRFRRCQFGWPGFCFQLKSLICKSLRLSWRSAPLLCSRLAAGWIIWESLRVSRILLGRRNSVPCTIQAFRLRQSRTGQLIAHRFGAAANNRCSVTAGR